MKRNSELTLLVLMALFMALCYVSFMFLKIPIPGTSASVHFGNAFCLIAVLVVAYLCGGDAKACIKGGVFGGICGALGMGIADLTSSPAWLPYTLTLKFASAMITGLVLAALVKTKLNEWARTTIACAAGMLFNLIAAPVANYLTLVYMLHSDAEASGILAGWSSIPSGINAVVSTFAAPALYLALRPALRRMKK